MNGELICMFKVVVNYDGANCLDHGFCVADNLVEAVRYLEDELYRDNLVEIHHLELIDACPIISLDVWERMRKELNEQ